MNSTKKCVLVPYEKYQRLINKTQNMPKHNDGEQEEQLEEEYIHDISEDESEHKLKEETILLHLPKTLKSKAKTLLDVINHNSNLDWNEKGELTVNGEALAHSHIADLVKDALVMHKQFQPLGMQEFYSNLKNIPLTLIRNPHRRELINQSGSGIIKPDPTQPRPPPPGLPNKRKAISLQKGSGNKKTKVDKWREAWTKLD